MITLLAMRVELVFAESLVSLEIEEMMKNASRTFNPFPGASIGAGLDPENGIYKGMGSFHHEPFSAAGSITYQIDKGFDGEAVGFYEMQDLGLGMGWTPEHGPSVEVRHDGPVKSSFSGNEDSLSCSFSKDSPGYGFDFEAEQSTDGPFEPDMSAQGKCKLGDLGKLSGKSNLNDAHEVGFNSGKSFSPFDFGAKAKFKGSDPVSASLTGTRPFSISELTGKLQGSLDYKSGIYTPGSSLDLQMGPIGCSIFCTSEDSGINFDIDY